MNVEKAKHLSNMFYAYLTGEKVQIKIVNDWKDVNDISLFRNVNNEFRIYQEQALIPFEYEDIIKFKDIWIRLKADQNQWYKILAFNKSCVFVCAEEPITYAELLENFTLEDCSPCGKYN